MISPRPWQHALSAALFTTCLACSHATKAPPPKPFDSGAIEFAGCAVVYDGPRCRLAANRQLRLWAPVDVPLAIAAIGSPQTPVVRAEPAFGGYVALVTLPPLASVLRVSGADGRVLFALELLDPSPVAPLDRARQLRLRGQFAEARRTLEEALPTYDAEAADHARALLARLAISEGDNQAAAAGLRASLERAYATGRLSDAAEDASALAYVLCRTLRNYTEARAVLERADRMTALDPGARALLGHYWGVLAIETGDLRSAIERFRTAATKLQRLGMRDHELVSRQEFAAALSILGRHREAVQEQERVATASTSDNACLQVDRQEGVTWIALLAEPAAGSDLATTALRSVERTQQLLSACPSPWRQRNHAINAALLALELGDPAQAHALLSALPPRADDDDLTLSTWEHEARARWLLASGQAQAALEMFQRTLALARRAELRDSEQLAWLGIARAHDRLGHPREAIDSYFAADAVIDEQLESVPLSEGPAGFQHAREAGTSELIELLVRTDNLDRALNLARRARIRVLHALSRAARLTQLDTTQRAHWEALIERYRNQRSELEHAKAAEWTVPVDALAGYRQALEARRVGVRSALDEANAFVQRELVSVKVVPFVLAKGEVVLAYFPRDSGFRAFAVSERGLRTVAGPELSSDMPSAQLSAAMLEPFRAELSQATRVRVLTHAALGALDIHALKLDGVPLGQRIPVAYSLDLRIALTRRSMHAPAALIVADPGGDLPFAEVEAREVARLTPQTRANVSVWLRDDAKRARISDQLAAVDWFHFAGHARHAGIEGIDSSFLVSDGEITVGDILSLPSAPRRVVLSACDGALTNGVGFNGGIGVAQAFVAAGSDEVIAAARPVRDELARKFFALFYAALQTVPQADGAEALRVATRDLHEDDWAAFRVLTP